MSAPVNVIEILGPGCSRCKETHRVVQHVVDDAKLDCLVQKNASLDRMVELGVMSTPAVVFDGHVVLTGHIPKTTEVRELLGLDEPAGSRSIRSAVRPTPKRSRRPSRRCGTEA